MFELILVLLIPALLSALLSSFCLIVLVFIFILFRPKINGFLGEKSVALILSRLDPTKYKVLNDIMLQINGRTTQIDHIVISNYGIFVIETKNYKGWIVGKEYDDYWKQVIYKRKEKLYNPIKQNYGHTQALKEILSDYSDVNYIPIVAFTIKADLKVNTKSHVVYTVKLLETIKMYTTETISETDKENIYQKLIASNIVNKDAKKAHVQAIHENIADKNRKIQDNICPKSGGNLVLRNGKYGKFKGCSNYPKCKFTLK